MIKFRHRFFLSVLFTFNLVATGLLYHLYEALVDGRLIVKDSQFLIDMSYTFFIVTIWILYMVIIYYAKNDHTTCPEDHCKFKNQK